MPELPEVEAVCRKLRRDALGACIAAARVLRSGTTRPQKTRRVESLAAGRIIETIERRGKNILIGLSGGMWVRVHLRMTGNLHVIPDVHFRPASTRAYFELEGGRGLIFDDPRALGRLHIHTTAEAARLMEDLGPEPLSPVFTLDALAAAAGRSRKPAKLFLMDQQHVAGLGNIYAAEALFRARIHPARPMNRIGPSRLAVLHSAIIEVLQEAVHWAVRSYGRPGEFSEAEDFPLAVYGREGELCVTCDRRVRRIPQGGRSTYYCPGCQR
ncbi:MAG TPA: bifunctional DNA-formamidopyrimidine glycosylase/DNA-(apurinic or apyrimidinic site) lyase [Bryobacteraceae bacterium]|nr:bifunctional DNA-formamidopyrimidine glycosylase/DNA-(apurinic or apyrimidinic site) lyase [Bryobacteraceae bacterium]